MACLHLCKWVFEGPERKGNYYEALLFFISNSWFLVFFCWMQRFWERASPPPKKQTEMQKAMEYLESKGVMLNIVHGIEGGWAAFFFNSSVTNEDLNQLMPIKPLRTLNIGLLNISDQGMTWLGNIDTLQFVVFEGMPITDLSIAKLCEKSKIKTLIFRNLQHITDKSMEKVGIMGSLENATFSQLPKVSEAGISYFLVRNPNLEILELANFQFSAKGLYGIRQLKKLKKMILTKNSITDETLKNLSLSESLQDLQILNGWQITDVGVKELVKVNSLEYLKLTETSITDESLKILSRGKKLAGLNLGKNRISDNGLKHVLAFPSLVGLGVEFTDVTDAGLEYLINSKIKEITLGGEKITDKGLAYLAQIKSLKIVNLHGTKTTARGIRDLIRALPGLIVGPPTK